MSIEDFDYGILHFPILDDYEFPRLRMKTGGCPSSDLDDSFYAPVGKWIRFELADSPPLFHKG